MIDAVPDTFEEFARARIPHLYRSAWLLCGHRADAEDLVQETLAKVYVRMHRKIGRRLDNPAAYAQTVLTRTFISGRRRSSSSELPYADLPDTGATPDAPDATDATDATDLRLALVDALADLAPVDRAVLVLRYLDDRPVDEVAATLGLTAGAVRNRSMRALARMRKETLPMTERDLSTLLERSSSRLAPDVDDLVAAGGRRGRRRLRRMRAAMGAALVAVVATCAVLPAVLGGSEDGGHVEPAAPPTSATTTGSPPGPENPRERVAPATAERRLVAALPRGQVEPVTAEPASWDQDGLSIYLRFKGADIFVTMNPLTNGSSSAASYSPRDACADPDGAPCRQTPDGSWISRRFDAQLWGVPGPLGHAVTRYTTDGWEIEVQAYDSTGLQSDDFRQVASRPVLTPRQVEALATSDRWFE